MKLITSVKPIITAFLIFGLLSCSREYETETFPNSALVTIKLQGLSSQLSSANMDIADIQFQVKPNANAEDAWMSLNTVNMGVHDLAQINGERVVTLVDFDEVNLGMIYGLKLVFGDNNTIVNNGVEYDLVSSSGIQIESVNVVDKEFKANLLYEFIIEFDIDRSVEISNGQAYLNPQTSVVMRRFELF
jgi:hypothetical protein